MSTINNSSESKEALEKTRKFWQTVRNWSAIAGLITLVIVIIGGLVAIGIMLLNRQQTPATYQESEYSAMLRRAQQTDVQNIIGQFEKDNKLWMREIHYFSTNAQSEQTIKALTEATNGKIEILENCSDSLLSAPNVMAYSKINEYDVVNFRITFPPATMGPTDLELTRSMEDSIEFPNKGVISDWEDRLSEKEQATVKILDIIKIPGDMYDEVSFLSAFKDKFVYDIPVIARYKGPTPLSGNQLIAYYKNGNTSKIYFLLLQPFEV